MWQALARYFRFSELQTNYKTEIIAGATTFATMAYIIVVNPKILQAAGMPFAPSMVATILTAFFGTKLFFTNTFFPPKATFAVNNPFFVSLHRIFR